MDIFEKVVLIVIIILFINVFIYMVFRSSKKKQVIDGPTCDHREWDMDRKTRDIVCRKCGKNARVLVFKNLGKQ